MPTGMHVLSYRWHLHTTGPGWQGQGVLRDHEGLSMLMRNGYVREHAGVLLVADTTIIQA